MPEMGRGRIRCLLRPRTQGGALRLYGDLCGQAALMVAIGCGRARDRPDSDGERRGHRQNRKE